MTNDELTAHRVALALGSLPDGIYDDEHTMTRYKFLNGRICMETSRAAITESRAANSDVHRFAHRQWGTYRMLP